MQFKTDSENNLGLPAVITRANARVDWLLLQDLIAARKELGHKYTTLVIAVARAGLDTFLATAKYKYKLRITQLGAVTEGPEHTYPWVPNDQNLWRYALPISDLELIRISWGAPRRRKPREKAPKPAYKPFEADRIGWQAIDKQMAQAVPGTALTTPWPSAKYLKYLQLQLKHRVSVPVEVHDADGLCLLVRAPIGLHTLEDFAKTFREAPLMHTPVQVERADLTIGQFKSQLRELMPGWTFEVITDSVLKTELKPKHELVVFTDQPTQIGQGTSLDWVLDVFQQLEGPCTINLGPHFYLWPEFSITQRFGHPMRSLQEQAFDLGWIFAGHPALIKRRGHDVLIHVPRVVWQESGFRPFFSDPLQDDRRAVREEKEARRLARAPKHRGRPPKSRFHARYRKTAQNAATSKA